MIMVRKWIYIVCVLAGLIAGVLVTRYAPECKEGFCWGQSPFLLMLVAGALTGLIVGSRPSGTSSPLFAGFLAGAIIDSACHLAEGSMPSLVGQPGSLAPHPPPRWRLCRIRFSGYSADSSVL